MQNFAFYGLLFRTEDASPSKLMNWQKLTIKQLVEIMHCIKGNLSGKFLLDEFHLVCNTNSHNLNEKLCS